MASDLSFLTRLDFSRSSRSPLSSKRLSRRSLAVPSFVLNLIVGNHDALHLL